jgi:hypothetical protein
MITSERVYTSLLTLVREDVRGNAFSPDEFNRMARIVNHSIYAKKYRDFETSTDNISTLAGFKELDVPLVLVAGATSLPSDYFNIIGKPRIVNNAGLTKRCDLVSQLELDERSDDFLTQPSESYPVYTLGELDGSDNLILHVYPTTITGNVTIDYLRDANIPFLDYYINNATLVVTYMAEGASVIIPTGYTYRGGIAGDGVTAQSSTTVDWEWDEDDFYLILSLFCSMLGLALPDQLLIQVGNAEEVKNTRA